MKRGFRDLLLGRVLVTLLALCSVSLLARPAIAESWYCPERTARLLYVSNPSWTSGAGATSSIGAQVRFTDCGGFASLTRTIAPYNATAIDDVSPFLCSTPASGVAILYFPVSNGCAALTTEAVYRDDLGNFNVVSIPELHSPLAEGSGANRYVGVRSGGSRSTFIALITEPAGSATRAELTIVDETGATIATDLVEVDGFNFYEVPQAFGTGTITIENAGPGVGPLPETTLYAVAFSGLREGGSPKVIPPEAVIPPLVEP